MTNLFSLSADLRRSIETREARVAVLGLGYVGLPLALTVQDAGFPAVGLDVNAGRVERINAGEPLIPYLGERRIAEAVASGRFRASDDMAELETADVVLICVPTPLDPDRRPDLSAVRRAGEEIARRLRPGQLVVLESTVWPGATAGVLRPLLEGSGLAAGRDFFLAFSPEREDPGSATHETRTIPKIVGADDPHSLELARLFYAGVVVEAVPVQGSAAAEAAKLFENTFRAVNIALVNEMKAAFDRMSIDVWEVIRAAATKPFGFMPFQPGPGIGGDCIPVSPVYLSWRARETGGETAIVDLACRINAAMPGVIADRLARELAARGRGGVEGARVLILGVAYKPDVADTRESPALRILELLEARGALCDYHDANFPVFPETRDHPHLAGRRSAEIDGRRLGLYDAVVVATDNSGVDYAGVAQQARLILDTRNVFHRLGIEVPEDRLVKA